MNCSPPSACRAMFPSFNPMCPTSSTEGRTVLPNSRRLPIHHSLSSPVSATRSLCPSCPTTRISRIPGSGSPCPHRAHCDTVPKCALRLLARRTSGCRFGGMGRADVDGAIAHPRRRHPSVSGSTICARRDGALGMVSVGKPCHRGLLRKISSLRSKRSRHRMLSVGAIVVRCAYW